MKFSVLVFIILGAAQMRCMPTSDHLTCSMFRNGKFILVNAYPLMKGELIRNGNTQVIKNLIKKTESIETIKWLSDCKYKIEEPGKPDSVWLTVEVVKIVGDTAYIKGSYPNIEYQPILKIVKVK
jgi:hypothetical protein